MKTILKFLMPALLMFSFASATVPSVFAQDDQEAVYNKFLANRKGPEVEKVKVAIAAGEEYLQKFGSDANNKDIVDYINKQLPLLKDFVSKSEGINSFDQAVRAKNWANSFSSGKQIIASDPDRLDILLVLASIGFDQAAANPPVDTYNADTVSIAKQAIQKLNEGKPSMTGNYGAYEYQYKNAEFADGKNNALGWMNYTAGYIMFNRMNQKKDALPYLYKASQANSATKNFPEVYRLIATWYRDEFNRIVEERKAKIDANNGQETDETKAALALQYAYAERAIDAYYRAYKVADPKNTAFRTALLNTAKEFYKVRFDKEDGFDAFVASSTAKSFADPTVAVTPVVLTPTQTTSGGTASVKSTDSNVTASTTRTTATTSPAAAGKTTTTTTKTTMTTTKTPAKTPVTKKKGTR